MGFDKEKFDVVDENDKVLYNVVGKDTLHSLSKDKFHRSVHIFIEVHGGRFVIQLKGAGTENAGKWSSSVSGHVRSGEEYIDAAIREVKEEVGLRIDREDLEKVATIQPCEDTGYEFVTLYEYLMDDRAEIIKPNPAEVEELRIMKLEDLINDIDTNPQKYSPAFRLAMEVFLIEYKS